MTRPTPSHITGLGDPLPREVIGVDSDPEAVERAIERVSLEGTKEAPPHLTVTDFFSCRPSTRSFANRLDAEILPSVDAVVGNPPYIRYHGFRGPVRSSAAAAVADQQIRLTDLTSSWAPFVVHATSFLKPGGRLAFVLPAELLSVDYARAIRDFLAVAYKSITIIAFDERVFPGVLADTVLVLADKQGAEAGLALVRLQNLSQLPQTSADLRRGAWVPFPDSEPKWSSLILEPSAREVYRVCDTLDGVSRLGASMSVDIGVVSGNNDFFVLTQQQLQGSRIPREEVIPIVSSSRHLKGARVGAAEFDEIRESGQRCWLLNLAGRVKISDEARVYLSSAGKRGTQSRYKVRTRRRWFDVPSVYAPDAFMSYFISEAPRFVVNAVGATSTNTIHRLRRAGGDPHATVPLILSCYSTLTQLSAEVEGRSYGGGVGKLETKEAESLRLVRPNTLAAKELRQAEAKIHGLLRSGSTSEATEIVDELLLEGQLGLSPTRIQLLKGGLVSLRSRRKSRMSGGPSRND